MEKIPRHIDIDYSKYAPDIPEDRLEAYYGLPKHVQFCKECVMSNQKPNSCYEFEHTINSIKKTMVIQEDGVCDACHACHNKANGHIDWALREKELRELCDQYRKNDGSYDCLVPGSGGKDSFYAAHLLKYKYGMHPLTVTWAPHIYTPWGWENMQAWIHAGFDNYLGISSEASAYDIARITDTPAVMILDCKGLSVSAVPCIQGFLHYKEDSRIKGVILNRLSPMMYGRMKEMIEVQTGIKVYGYVPVMKDCALESRYLGLKLPKERKDTEDKLTRLGEQILKSVDIAGLLELAENAPELQENAQYSTESVRTKDTVRIGLASDDAFCFFYQDNLELLQEMGAELIPFSPLYDKQIPEKLSGLLFYGGYPELYAEELSKNESMKTSIKKALNGGMPCIAECGGFMYLQEYIRDESGTEFPMVGFLEGKSYPTGSLKRFGYVTLTGGRIFGKEAGDIPAHEFHYYDSEVCGEAFLAEKPMSNRSWKCMISTDTVLAGYPHIHYYGNEKIPENFLEQCRRCREQEKRARERDRT